MRKLFRSMSLRSVAVIAFATFSATLFLPVLTVAQEGDSAAGKCSQRAVVNFATATLFKALHAGGGATKTSILGFKLPDIFPEITYDHSLDFWTCVEGLLEQAAKVALERFRKRLLDRMTDDIIGWISDGRDPKFITNFGDFIEEAAQAAVGDTARAVGLADLCSPFRYRIPPLLKPIPTFSQQVSCTLDDIVDNIEGFYQDFARGGPLAYTESLSPNNNYLGALFATQDELRRQTAKKQEEAKLAAVAGGGYKPIEECYEWTISGRRRVDGEFIALTAVPDGTNLTNNPYLPPGPGSQPYENAANTIVNPRFECTDKKITLPPAGTQQIANVALTADTQYLANTSDLTPYLTAIFNAATNRIIKEGVKGLRGNPSNLRSESGGGPAPQPLPDATFCRRADLTPDQLRDCRYAGYGGEYATSTNLTAQLRNELTAQIAETQTSVLSASTTLTRLITLNSQLIATTTALSGCEISRKLNPDPNDQTKSYVCENTSSTLSLARATALQFDADRTALTTTLQSLVAIKASLASNTAHSESSLTSLLGSVSIALNTVRTTQNRLNDLVVALLKAGANAEKALQACQTGTYSCSWTPSP